MKIGILTQPLHTNYGGLLQAYALQTILKKNGHDPYIIDRQMPPRSKTRIILSLVKTIVFNLLKKDNKRALIPDIPSKEQQYFISQNTRKFIQDKIKPITDSINTTTQLTNVTEKYNFEVFIVGSDQVWRPIYSPCIYNYFFDFIAEKKGIKRLSYAASFGVDDWEFSKEQTKICKKLISLFDDVSVREASGIDLCSEYFNKKACFVLDPTLLLNKDDYINLFDNISPPNETKQIMSYILDYNKDKEIALKYIEKELNKTSFKINDEMKFSKKNRKKIETCIVPSVEKWLAGFYYSDFIVTDSFHGCIFSIIFNKPFIAIGNTDRGLARFTSLLSIFKLESRLIYSINDLNRELVFEKIDWEKTNLLKDKYVKLSMEFLNKNLSK